MTTIEQYLEDQEHDGRWGTAHDALRSVAERHAPETVNFPGRAHPVVFCKAHISHSRTYPCDELRVIYKALGIDGKDQT